MNEHSVQTAAQAHVRAIVEKNLEAALSYVVPGGRQDIGRRLTVVAPLVSAATVDGIELSAGRDQAIAYFRFVTTDPAQKDVLVESHWVERDGRPLLSYAHAV